MMSMTISQSMWTKRMPTATNQTHVRKTISVPEAGEYFGLKRNAAYEAARRGELPIIKIGKRLRVPVVALERMLEEARPAPRDST
jgi:excisionase family DNA binding protein